MLSIAAFVAVTSLTVPGAQSADLAALFPPAREGLLIQVDPKDANSATSLTDVLSQFTRSTGITIQTTKETQAVMRNVALGLNRSVDVPPSEVYRIVEVLLRANDFVVDHLSDREPRIWSVVSLQSGPHSRASAIWVEEKDLQAWQDHAATLVSTTIQLPNTDVRTLSNSMRAMFTDVNTQQIIPAGASSLLITGFAPDVVALARMLHRIDAESKLVERPPQSAEQPKAR